MSRAMKPAWSVPAIILLLAALACSTQASAPVTPAQSLNPPTIAARTPTPLASLPTVGAVEPPGPGGTPAGVSILWRVPVPGNGSPGLLNVDPLGDVSLATGQGGAYIFDPDGNVLVDFNPGEGSLIVDIKMDLYGNLLLADPPHHQVIVASPGGEFLGSFGRQGTADGEFSQDSPLALEVSPITNNYYTLNKNPGGSRLQVFDGNDGRFMRSFPLGEGAFQDMAFSADNLLYILDRANPGILKVDPETGLVLERLGAEALAGSSPRGLALDAAGNLYLSLDSSPSQAAIYVLDAQGGLEMTLGGLTSTAGADRLEGTFFEPGGIAVTSDGRLLFLADGAQGSVYLTAYQVKD